jgi:hypothetical protein
MLVCKCNFVLLTLHVSNSAVTKIAITIYTIFVAAMISLSSLAAPLTMP